MLYLICVLMGIAPLGRLRGPAEGVALWLRPPSSCRRRALPSPTQALGLYKHQCIPLWQYRRKAQLLSRAQVVGIILVYEHLDVGQLLVEVLELVTRVLVHQVL